VQMFIKHKFVFINIKCSLRSIRHETSYHGTHIFSLELVMMYNQVIGKNSNIYIGNIFGYLFYLLTLDYELVWHLEFQCLKIAGCKNCGPY
jgi:hypothetical protein